MPLRLDLHRGIGNPVLQQAEVSRSVIAEIINQTCVLLLQRKIAVRVEQICKKLTRKNVQPRGTISILLALISVRVYKICSY